MSSKLHEKTEDILKNIKDGNMVTAVSKLKNMKTMVAINGLLSREELSKKDTRTLENLILISKALFEANQYMSGVTYNLLPDNLYDVIVEKYKGKSGGDEPFQSFVTSGLRSTDQDFVELSGTLDKAYTIYDDPESGKPSVEKWLRAIMKSVGIKYISIIVDRKFDGTSITGTLENKKKGLVPVKATTRGDFENNKGVDLSAILVGRPSIKSEFADKYLKDDKLGVQYEALVTEKGKEKLSKLFGVEYKTRRAAIAAALKRLTNSKTTREEAAEINKCITLVPLMVSDNLLLSGGPLLPLLFSMKYIFTYSDIKFSHEPKVFERVTVEEFLKQFSKYVDKEMEARNDLDYSIDGLVISILDPDRIRSLGRKGNKNKWQIAYKFDAMVKRTKVTGIVSSQGKQGYIGHNITFDEIEFNGVKYDMAPVNNITRFEKLDLRIGDEVLVSYNADVMGYIYKDETCKPNLDGEKIQLPDKCINCGKPLTFSRDMLLCINDDCSGHKVGTILEAIRIFGIDHIGEETAIKLVKDAKITTLLKFLDMEIEDMAKAISGENLKKAWKEFKKKISAPIVYSKVLDLLRIPNLRTKTAEKILADIPMTKLMEYVVAGDPKELISALKKVKGIDTNAKMFAVELIGSLPLLCELNDRLNTINDKNDFSKRVLISGFRTDDDFFDICDKLNFKVVTSGKYDLLVVGPSQEGGKKHNEALKHDKDVMLLADFIKAYK